MTAATHTEPNDAGSATLTDIAYSRLSDDILSGRLLPDTKLAIEHLRRDYGIGASPLREALSRLAADGLVTVIGQRGFRVAPATVADLRDITRLRILLETEALRESLCSGDEDWEAAVVAAWYRLSKIEPERGQRFPEWEQRNHEFHEALVAACRSPRLLQLRAALYDQHRRYRSIAVHYRSADRDVSGEHEAIYRACLERRIDDACELSRVHIQHTAALVAEVLAANSALPQPVRGRGRPRKVAG